MPASQTPTPAAPIRQPGPSRPGLQLWALDPSAIYHKGAVVTRYSPGYDKVIEPWGQPSPDPQLAGAAGVIVVGCDKAGNVLPEEKPRWHCTYPASYRGSRMDAVEIVKSADPRIPDGANSSDAALLLVPFGPQKGMMLGELSDAERVELGNVVKTEQFRMAIEKVNPFVVVAPVAAPADSPAAPPAVSAPEAKEEPAKEQERAPARPAIRMGEIDLEAFYHEGAVIKSAAGEHLLLVSGWGMQEGAKNGPAAQAVRCTPDGVAIAGAKPGLLDHVPASFLAHPSRARAANAWTQAVTVLKSRNASIPDAISSTDPSLLLVPYGPHFGKMLGSLGPSQRKVLAQLARQKDFKDAIEKAQPLPGAPTSAQEQESGRLSKEGMRTLLHQQGELIRSLPMVTVIEQFCGYAPDEISGKTRKYRIGSEFINLNTARNSFGSLNEYKFKTLKKDRGSSNNAIDIVAGVREMEGMPVDFGAIRESLIRHFQLQPQLDSMFKDALAAERKAIREGKNVEYAPAPKVDVGGDLKSAAGKAAEEEKEIPFNLATGTQEDASEEDIKNAQMRGGGFPEREDLWPAARKYLVEERRLAPELIDYLYAHRNLYAARRQFPVNPSYPYRRHHEDVIVAPVIGFKTAQVVGVDTKPLPLKPGEKTDGRNHGKTGQGAFMFGTWGPETERVILTEGFIKGIAFLQLHRKSLRIGPETCVMSRSGAKPTLEIIPQLKERKARAIVAYDNDFVGRDKARKFYEECLKQGVPCEQMFVEPSEVTLSISQNELPGYHSKARAQSIEQQVLQFASANNVPWAFEREQEAEGYRSIRMPNTEQVINFLEGQLNDDRRLSGQEYQSRAKGLSFEEQRKMEKRRWLKLSIHSKDWDDILKKGAHQPRIPEWQGPVVPTAPMPPAPVVASPVAEKTLPAAPQTTVATAPAKSVPSAPESAPTAPPGGSVSRSSATVVDGLLVARQSANGTVYSVGVAGAIYDIALTEAQHASAASLFDDELPRDARVVVGDKTQVVGIRNIDGTMCDTEFEVSPAPDAIQRAWKNPRNPSIIDAQRRLQPPPAMRPPPPPPQKPSLEPAAA